MHLKKDNQSIHLIVFLLLGMILYACARPQSPTGGPRDETPPQLLVSDPVQETLFFDRDYMTLEFDEFIQLKNVTEELTVTPQINDDYEYSYSKKKVTLKNLILEDSTTYTFNFGGAVIDMTESNPAENLIIIFSTGHYLDSLSINGKVTDLLSGERVENALIGLYALGDTLNIFTGRAAYAIKADENGVFQFTNLKNGDYLLYTVNDKNNNFKAESDREEFGFYPDTIRLEQNIDSLNLFVRKRNFQEFNITGLRTQTNYFQVRTNKYISDYQITDATDSTNTIYSNLTDENHNLRIYNTIGFEDSLLVNFSAYDTIYQRLDSSFYIKFADSRISSPDFAYNISEGKINPNELYEATITFNKPVKTFSPDSVFFKYDSLDFDYLDPENELTWNKNLTRLEIRKQLDKSRLKKDTSEIQQPTEKSEKRVPGQRIFQSQNSKKIEFYIGKDSFISIESDSSQSKSESYNFVDAAELGIIRGTIQSPYPHLIVQLLDSQNNLIKTSYKDERFDFINLKPGDYKIRIIIDENNNQEWDLGNYETLTPPELIYHYNKVITVRVNFEFIESIIIPTLE